MSEPSFKADFIKKNGFYLSTPQGVSMRPFIRGDVDTVMLAPIGEMPRRYDVVLYDNGKGGHVLHRVIRIKDGIFFIRGDNCYFTEKVKKEQLMGKLVHLYRNGKTDVDLLDGRGYRLLVKLWIWAYPLRYAARYVVLSGKKIVKRMRRKQ